MKSKNYELFFKALANRHRLKIVDCLRKSPCSVNSLVDSTGLKQAHVSRSLTCLLQCGFVSVSRKGRERVYKLNGSIQPLLAAADRHMKFYTENVKGCKIIR